MKKLFDQTLWKFLLVGVVNTLAGSAVMFGCYNLLGLGYWVSSAANYVCGSILSYGLNKRFTFQSREKGSLGRFTIHILVCYLLAYGAARPVTHWALSATDPVLRDNAAMLVGLALFTLLNYLGQRWFVFSGPSSGNRT